MPQLTPQLVQDIVTATDHFGFEMRVGNVLRGIPDAEIAHGGIYTPLGINETPRQFDFRVTLNRVGNYTVFLAVEAKHFHPSSPVVVCCAHRLKEESRLDLVVSDVRFVQRYGNVEQDYRSIQHVVRPCGLYPEEEFVGKSVVRPEPVKERKNEVIADSGYKVSGDGDVYEKWNQAALHSFALLANHAGSASRHPHFAAAIPIVVFPDGVLWSVGYANDGTIDRAPRQEHHIPLFMGIGKYLGSDVSCVLSHVHFVTITGLKNLIEDIAQSNSPLLGEIFSATAIQDYNNNRGDVLPDR